MDMPQWGTFYKREMCPTGPLARYALRRQVREVVPNNLKALRLRAGLSQAELGSAINSTGSYYGKVERGDKTLTLEFIEKLAVKLGVEPYAIIAPDRLFPTEEQLADMLQLAQQQLPVDLPYSEWPRVVASGLHTRLLTLADDRANAPTEDA